MGSYMPVAAILFGISVGFALCLLRLLFTSNVGASDTRSLSPVIGSVVKLYLKPGDVLVLKYDGRMRPEMHDSLREELRNIIPRGIKTMVIDESLSIHAVFCGDSFNAKEGNADAHNSDKNSPEPFPLSEVKLNDASGK